MLRSTVTFCIFSLQFFFNEMCFLGYHTLNLISCALSSSDYVLSLCWVYVGQDSEFCDKFYRYSSAETTLSNVIFCDVFFIHRPLYSILPNSVLDNTRIDFSKSFSGVSSKGKERRKNGYCRNDKTLYIDICGIRLLSNLGWLQIIHVPTFMSCFQDWWRCGRVANGQALTGDGSGHAASCTQHPLGQDIPVSFRVHQS